MLDFLLFMLFSTLEGISVYALTLYIFRFNLKHYIIPVLIVVLIMNLQSYAMREDTTFSYLVPVINLICTMLFMAIVVKIPFIWSLITGVTGYFAFGLLQTIIVYLSYGYLSITEVQTVALKGYMLQTITGLTGIYLGWILYKFGLGFAFEFEKLRFRWEPLLIIFFIIVFLILLGIMVYYRNTVLNLLSFMISMAIFLHYVIQKEVAN